MQLRLAQGAAGNARLEAATYVAAEFRYLV